MRIAHITATFPPSYTGTGMVCYYNAIGLAQLGHQVSVYTADHPPGSFVYPEEISVHRLPCLFRYGNAPLLPHILDIHNFDLIHLHHPFIFGAELTWLISRLRNIPYIITHHNDLKGNGTRGKLFDLYSLTLIPLIFCGAKKCVVVSLDHAIHSRYRNHVVKNNTKFVEIPNAVDTHIFTPEIDGKEIRLQNGIHDTDPVLLFVGALDRAHHYRKVDLLIHCVRQIADKSVHLMIVGEGDQVDKYRGMAADLNISKQVHFLGKISHINLPLIYAAADIFILPSVIQEAFPLVVLEAMASGKPVVVSDLPGVRSMIDDGENGYLIQPGNLSDLIIKINKLLESADRRRDFGIRGHMKVTKEYTWDSVVPKLELLYKSTLESM